MVIVPRANETAATTASRRSLIACSNSPAICNLPAATNRCAFAPCLLWFVVCVLVGCSHILHWKNFSHFRSLPLFVSLCLSVSHVDMRVILHLRIPQHVSYSFLFPFFLFALETPNRSRCSISSRSRSSAASPSRRKRRPCFSRIPTPRIRARFCSIWSTRPATSISRTKSVGRWPRVRYTPLLQTSMSFT